MDEASAEWVTSTRASELVGSSPSYILQLQRQGKLRAIRVEGAGGKPGPRLFRRADIVQLIVKRVTKAMARAS